MAQGFQHTPLTKRRTIRVLDLLPSLKRDALVRCKTREIELGDPRESYEAISYVWGALTGECPISCNGQELLVTPNCRDALLQLRRPFRARTLWIDAICVDQSDAGTQERNEQIKFMGQIFRKASCVIVWLGVADKHISRLFHFIRAVEHLLHPELIPPGNRVINIIINLYKFLKIHHSSDRLLSHPWFSRVWTIQELAASTRCIMQCGGSLMKWDAWMNMHRYFMVITNTLLTALLKSRINVSELTKTLNLSFDPDLYDISQANSWGDLPHRTRAQYDNLLNIIGISKATVPHDRIYGIYSILRAAGIRLSPPDYNKSINEVFEDVAVSYVRDRKKLSILMLRLPPDEGSGLPSWVPDWNAPVVVSDFGNPDVSGVFGDYLYRRGGIRGAGCFAGRESAHIFIAPTSLGQLIVRAKFLGRLTKATSWTPSEDDPEWTQPHLLSCYSMACFRGFISICQEWCRDIAALPSYPTGEDPRCVASQSFIPFLTKESEKETMLWFDAMMYPDCHQLSRKVIEANHDGATDDPTSAVFEFIRSGNIGRPKTNADKVYHIQATINIFASYALFFLDNGYMGLAHRTCQEGDRVFLLAGSDWPFILRQKGDAYRIVAPASIHGAMKGELWPDDESELELITLV